MSLQLIIKKPPGDFYYHHPDQVVEALTGREFTVATNSELAKHGRDDLINTALAVDIDQVVSLFDDLGKPDFAEYWRKYLVDHPDDNFLLFSIDREEMELTY